MEPWDGPAAIAATDGRWVIAGTGPQRFAAVRYTITGDGLLIVGSETGMVKVDGTASRRRKRPRSGPAR